jgi:hypothetical protein
LIFMASTPWKPITNFLHYSNRKGIMDINRKVLPMSPHT